MKKWMTMLALLCAAAVFGSVPAFAGQINFSGSTVLTQVGGTNGFPNPSVGINFSGLADSNLGDALNGTAVTITPSNSDGFVFDQLVGNSTTAPYNGGTGYFASNANGGTISVGNATTGTLNGNIDFVEITSNDAGAFTVNVGLNNLNITSGTSALLTSLVGSNNGNGTLTFQFTAGNGPQNLYQLLNISGTSNTSVSGSVAVPEPATLAMLGAGLLLLGTFLRRRVVGLGGIAA
jgi:hypothetical protein